MHAQRFLDTNDFPVSVVGSGSAMPSGMVWAPGNYLIDGVYYDCTAPGLYEFWNEATNVTRKRIVWGTDTHALMSAMSWVTCNGRGEENMAIGTKTFHAMTSHIRALCQRTCEWVKAMLDSPASLNQARIVRCLTSETPNNLVDGHVLIEVKVNGNWVLYDMAMGNTYGGLSLKDAVPLIGVNPSIDISDQSLKVSLEPYGGTFDISAWWITQLRTPTKKRAALERLLQIPGIQDANGHSYFYIPDGLPDRTAWIQGLSVNWHVMTKAAWLAKYYP